MTPIPNIDILFLAFNRYEFTCRALECLISNTWHARVRRLLLYDDCSSDGTGLMLRRFADTNPQRATYIRDAFNGPVGAMNHYLTPRIDHEPAEVWAKIDNDTCVPPGWLEACLELMEEQPEIDLLGIEAMSTPVPYHRDIKRRLQENAHIGGIGLMRTRCFKTLPTPRGEGGRFGFTEWQHDRPEIVKGFLHPPVPVALLDHIPREPWLGLTRQYVTKGWARAWGSYGQESHKDWEWVL